MTKVAKKKWGWHPIVVIASSIVVMVANAMMALEARRLRGRIDIRSNPSGGELEALRLIPAMESQLRALQKQRESIPG